MPGEKQDVKDPLQETKTLMACVEVGKLLTSTLNLREILELIMLKVSQLVQAQNWSLLLKDEKSNELIFEVVVGINKELIKEIRLKPGEGIAGHVAETGKPIYLSNAQNDPRFNPKVDNRTGFTTYLNSEPTPVKVTASFGLAMFPEDAKTRKELLLIADNSMYRIKKSTKNGIGMI